jgi:hypothetical protein
MAMANAEKLRSLHSRRPFAPKQTVCLYGKPFWTCARRDFAHDQHAAIRGPSFRTEGRGTQAGVPSEFALSISYAVLHQAGSLTERGICQAVPQETSFDLIDNARQAWLVMPRLRSLPKPRSWILGLSAPNRGDGQALAKDQFAEHRGTD